MGDFEIVDDGDGWVVRAEGLGPEVRFVTRAVKRPALTHGPLIPAAQAYARAIADAPPQLQALLATPANYVVEFSPDVQKLLKSGAFELMKTQGRTKVIAVDRVTRQIVEQGWVVEKGVQAAMAGAMPTLLVGMAANAAAAAQMARIETAIDEVRETLGRIEQRSWAIDAGTIHAAASLARALHRIAPAQRLAMWRPEGGTRSMVDGL